MKELFSNVFVDLLFSWLIVGCGATAIQSDTAFWLKIILWLIVFVSLDIHVYIKNKIK